jgi:hypothetical protein
MMKCVFLQRSKGLFAAAAIESGAFAHWNSMPLEGAQAVYDQVQEDAGCSDLGCLAKMDWAEVGKFGTAAGLRGYCKYHTSYEPVVDGVELTANVWCETKVFEFLRYRLFKRETIICQDRLGTNMG